MSRRRALLLVLVVACDGPAARPGGDGAMDAAYLSARKLEFLRHATSTPLAPASVTHTLAYLRAHELDPARPMPSVPADAWAASLAKMAALEDTRDFDALYLLELWLHYRDHPALPPQLIDDVETALLGFKYWYTEPTPSGRVDASYYWTENHELIYRTVEYLMGRSHPDVSFGNDGASGADHAARARAALERWLDHRLRFGFSEWHSNVYYQKDVTPLLALVDHADEEPVATLAAAVLDLLVVDLALHQQRGAFGVTHGRSYTKDKMSSLDEDTWTLGKLLFDASDGPWQAPDDPGGVLLALSSRYRPPELARRIATSTRVYVDRERLSLPIDEDGPPFEPVEGPYGLGFSDPTDVDLWWSMGALGTWPVVPATLARFEQFGLWDHPAFTQLAAFRDLAGDPDSAQFIASRMSPLINMGLLSQVNTYTWRSPEVMLSSAIDHRKGRFAWQVHSWQATFDADAIVFTNHPRLDASPTGDWSGDDEQGGYWNGEASMPRSAQHENVAIHIYAPQYDAVNAPPFDFFGFQPFTHAYVPQARFDELVLDGHWLFVRRGDGYLALYSYRTPEFRVYEPSGPPFDLVARGGADNVWIVECGRAADWDDFPAFRRAVAAAALRATPLAVGFDVDYESPSQGRLSFGWQRPFAQAGRELPTGEFARFDNPWGFVEFDAAQIELRDGDWGLLIDRERRTRWLYGPSGARGE